MEVNELPLTGQLANKQLAEAVSQEFVALRSAIGCKFSWWRFLSQLPRAIRKAMDEQERMALIALKKSMR